MPCSDNRNNVWILGISCWYHDSAACLIADGEIVASASEERFTRIKHDADFPKNAIQFCLTSAGIELSQVDYVAFYEKPIVKFDRIFETYLAFAPFGFANFKASFLPWVKDKLFQKTTLIKQLELLSDQSVNWNQKLLFSEHHLSHAASAFFPSPFTSAAVVTMDGVGEHTTASISVGVGNSLRTLKTMNFPHSLGLLYSAFTYYTGFKVNSGEYKLMGLAPFGKPKFYDIIRENLIDLRDDGSFSLNMKFFGFCTELQMTNKRFEKLFGFPPKKEGQEISQRDADLAASIQKLTEEIVLKIAVHAKKITGEDNLCLAGGVALNCVANGLLIKEKIFKDIWIQPAAGDAGGALGAAFAAHHIHLHNKRESDGLDKMNGSYLGPEFTEQDIEQCLKENNANYRKLSDEGLSKTVAELLSLGKAVGWMQGKMEFGPRALGARSILADPRRPTTQKNLNLKIKFRESFRPFAPSILEEHTSDWFQFSKESPYMLFVTEIDEGLKKPVSKSSALSFLELLNQERSAIPAVTHIDFSARLQTVNSRHNPKFYNLIKAFYQETGCPIVVNTSFNIRGEPIVCSPNDAYRCFMGTDLDVLVIGNFLLKKDDQDQSNLKDYRADFELD